MLVVGAALGVLSLRVSNDTLQGVKQTQDVADAMDRVVNSYKDALNGLGRAAASHYGAIVSAIGQPVQVEQGLGSEAAGLLQRAKASLNRAETEYEYYKGLARPASAADSLKEVENAFEALVGQGLHPLAAALEKGDISAASEEQSSGIEQVNRAVSQMDEVTQQNAALVEEAAAAAGSLQEQAQRLAEAVAVFKINTGEVIEVPAHQLGSRQAPGAREAALARDDALALGH
ncbi:Tar ligand binding domain-containing protein [Bordetella pertussis]|nr:Tar ligand binding domain-containing protein [Bordetella pertussis]WIP59608.1 Tar ligand binding domain-containing protein [Bordetella pertussis]WIP63243.1 Tar ligand binding domain-containing protein [Bordetella pertussis]WIP88789.1 Tar ligand binding domain-containing protein [Bordetella pertussis]WIQ07054.1 Tar ligand binding domain-containing protein [Bordetella pertussis]